MNRRLRAVVRGTVQGVGFRPYVYRLARELDLAGWVLNGPQGVRLEAEGPAELVEEFRLRLPAEAPPQARIHGLETQTLDPAGYHGFTILPSETGGEARPVVPPDIACCEDCRREIFDPSNRRYRYPFTNCTQCGPRYTIVEDLPYDRPETSMKGFEMCAACRAEYEDPGTRRFHAQPNACAECGPELRLISPDGSEHARREAALRGAVDVIRDGGIVALKGLGGFHLVVDARSDYAVRRLRERKRREEKPLAVMVPSLGAVESLAHAGRLERQLLQSPEAPIVLLNARRGHGLAAGVAPDNPYLGILLPYTPLHWLLLRDLGHPVVATSGNLTDEPICIDDAEALERLGGIADIFLSHDRPILRPVDDSVVSVAAGREMVLRRARGFAPASLPLPEAGPAVLAFGAHLKNTVALGLGAEAVLSPHIGDLDTPAAETLLHETVGGLTRMYGVNPEYAACDAHPDYRSTQLAIRTGLPLVRVQHHLAHAAAVMAENEVPAPALAVSWDGTGYGPDSVIWGGEFLRAVGQGEFLRFAHLRPFRLPGGEAAVREPRRTAFSLLYELIGSEVIHRTDLAPVASFSPKERRLLLRMLQQDVQSPWTTSAGRLFDAIASLADVSQHTRFEGQSAMALEFAAGPPEELGRQHAEVPVWPMALGPADPDGSHMVDWEPLLRAMLADLVMGAPKDYISQLFHRSLARGILRVARAAEEPRVLLTGGCFQNRLLLEETVRGLEADGFRAYWHQRVPPNDGGIALGQLVLARSGLRGGRREIFAGREDAHVSGHSR